MSKIEKSSTELLIERISNDIDDLDLVEWYDNVKSKGGYTGGSLKVEEYINDRIAKIRNEKINDILE